MKIVDEVVARMDEKRVRQVKLGIAVLIVLIALEIYATYLIPEWRKMFYNVIEKKDQSGLLVAIKYFVFLMGALIVSQSFKGYVARITALHMRTGLTKLLLKDWVKGGALDRVDNPSQRINEDCKIATDKLVRVGIEIVISAALVVMLIWQSRHDTMMIVSSVVYTLVISIAAMIYKKPLIDREIALQRSEADHRHSISKIELGMGDFKAKGDYVNVVLNCKKYLRTLLGYNVFNSAQNQFSILVPWFILSIPYFNGSITLGGFMGSVAVFELIVVNSTILVTLFPEATQAQASWIRIAEFYKALDVNKKID